MKRYILAIMFLLSMVQISAHAQEAILEEISEMKNVEVVYISKAMLKSMRAHGMNVGGMNISTLANELSSLNIMTVEDERAVSKVRNKLKTVGKDYNMEVVVKIKDSAGSTEMYATRDSKNYYAQLLTIVDEGDEMTIIYMTGTIGMGSLNELTKKNNARINKNKNKNTSYYGNFGSDIEGGNSYADWGILGESLSKLKDYGILDNIDFGSLNNLNIPDKNESNKIYGNIEQSLNELERKLNVYRDSLMRASEKVTELCASPYNINTKEHIKYSKLMSLYGDSINRITQKITMIRMNQARATQPTLNNINRQIELYRDSLDRISLKIAKVGKDYELRSKLYEERSRLYENRNKLYETRNKIRRQGIEGKNKSKQSSKKVKNKVYVGGDSYVWVTDGDEAKDKWYLVVASYKTKKEAEKYIKKNNLKNTEILKGGNGWYRISVSRGSFDEIEALRNSDKYKDTGAWICYKELNI